ncbi:MAG: PepSY-associated TM helix domain-containing protein, partial [Pseudomonadota bacterium]
AKARDYNWHHVFSVWALIPLLLIVISGVVISFPWANDMVYAAYGESEHEHDHDHPHHDQSERDASEFLSHQEVLEAAVQHAANHGAGDWHSIWMDASESPGAPATFYIDRSIGHRLEYGYDLTLDGRDGEVLEFMRIADYSEGDQARWFLRFLHTGDAYGFFGQTIALLASLAACVLVYTGLALAWRRLISPLLRRSG